MLQAAFGVGRPCAHSAACLADLPSHSMATRPLPLSFLLRQYQWASPASCARQRMPGRDVF